MQYDKGLCNIHLYNPIQACKDDGVVAQKPSLTIPYSDSLRLSTGRTSEDFASSGSNFTWRLSETESRRLEATASVYTVYLILTRHPDGVKENMENSKLLTKMVIFSRSPYLL